MSSRRILLVTHPRRPEAIEIAHEVARRLQSAGIAVATLPDLPDGVVDDVAAASGCELVVVLGGDGTILRGVDVARSHGVPVLGANLGHIGFLAELEREDIAAMVDHIVARAYTVEERMALDVRAQVDGEDIYSGWALNEASVEKAARERMIDMSVEIDGRPLSTWGCDGVVLATPTGSTAYAFSAGGPVVWPNVEALLLVPLSAHALFARPLVVAPTSRLAVGLIPTGEAAAVLWCDGRRTFDLPAGAWVQVERSATPVRLARLQTGAFTDRLVRKFDLPTTGWRGSTGPTPGGAAD
ncbi:MAG: NAD kinase [Nostocoides sp.]